MDVLPRVQQELVTRSNITEVQRLRFIEGLERGLPAAKAALRAKINVNDVNGLLDLLQDRGVKAAVNLAVHNIMATTGKQLAWKVAEELMMNASTPPTVRWSAAKWTLEATGEGIGQTRKNPEKAKDLHQMTEAELTQFVAMARAVVERTAIDITPTVVEEGDEYGGLV